MDDILTEVMKVLTPVLALVLASLAAKGLQLLHIKVDENRTAKLQHYATLAVQYAEEAGRRQLGKTGQAMPGAMKQQIAENFVASHLPKADVETVRDLIGAVLPAVRQTIVSAPTVAVPDPNVQPPAPR